MTIPSGAASGSGLEVRTKTSRPGQGHFGAPSAGSNVVLPISAAPVVSSSSGNPYESRPAHPRIESTTGHPSGVATKPSTLTPI